jgi:hypothetical protein
MIGAKKLLRLATAERNLVMAMALSFQPLLG